VQAFTNFMELRSTERPEPSHIHVPRPSRVTGRQAPLAERAADDLRLLLACASDTRPMANAD
jgi:hypothetical protein